jgi:thiol oxidase
MAYLKHLLLKINEKSKGLSGNQFLEIIDMKTSNAYLPDDHQGYQSCEGSAPQYRGYPCALWLLFHTLTVSQYKKGLSFFSSH